MVRILIFYDSAASGLVWGPGCCVLWRCSVPWLLPSSGWGSFTVLSLQASRDKWVSNCSCICWSLKHPFVYVYLQESSSLSVLILLLFDFFFQWLGSENRLWLTCSSMKIDFRIECLICFIGINLHPVLCVSLFSVVCHDMHWVLTCILLFAHTCIWKCKPLLWLSNWCFVTAPPIPPAPEKRHSAVSLEIAARSTYEGAR